MTPPRLAATYRLQFNREFTFADAATFTACVEALQRHDMGLILDVVPNHMGVGGDDNAWWLAGLPGVPNPVSPDQAPADRDSHHCRR